MRVALLHKVSRRLALTAVLVLVALGHGNATTVAPAGSFTVAIASDDPLLWNDYGRAHARFRNRVTNTGSSADAYVVVDVERPPSMTAGAFGWVSSPSPALPLDPAESGYFYVWFSGFEQPPPAGPGAGDYTATVRIRPTVSAAPEQSIQATVRRSFPDDPGSGIVAGMVTDADGAPLAAGSVSLGDPTSLLASDRSSRLAGGLYSITAPAGEYWLAVDADGYRSAFKHIELGAGERASYDFALAINDVRAGVTVPTAIGDAGLPTYRASMSSDLSRVATMPGFYTRTGGANEQLLVFNASGKKIFSATVPPTSTLELDVGEWTSTDHGLDLSPDGSRVAMGTAGGTIELFDVDSGERLWLQDRKDDRNPLVPGPLGEGLLRSSEVRFSPDGSKLAAGSLAGHIYLFDAEAGALLWKFATPGQVRALRFSPKGDRVYAGSGGNYFYALNAVDGRLIRRTEILFWPWEHIAMDKKGRQIATGGKDGVLRVFKKTGKLRWSRELPGFIMGYEFAPDGKSLFVNHGPSGIYRFDKRGSIEWYRRETMGSGEVYVDPGGAFVAYCQVSPASAPAVRVLQPDGTLIWEYRGGADQESFFHVRLLADGSRLIATNQVAGKRGQALIFDGWLR